MRQQPTVPDHPDRPPDDGRRRLPPEVVRARLDLLAGQRPRRRTLDEADLLELAGRPRRARTLLGRLADELPDWWLLALVVAGIVVWALLGR